MAALHASAEANVAHVQGSVDAIPARRGVDHDSAAVDGMAAEIGARGLPVFAFARKEFPREKRALDHADLEGGLTFVGLQATLDPPRPKATQTVASGSRPPMRTTAVSSSPAPARWGSTIRR